MNTSGRTNGNGRTNGRINVNRRVNTTVRTNTGGGSNMLIGILVIALIGGAIYFFLSKKFDPDTFSGTLLAGRLTGNLLDLIKAFQPADIPLYIIDCSNNIVWKKGDAVPSKPSTGTYTTIFKTSQQLPASSFIINKGELIPRWKDSIAHPISPNLQQKSIVLSNTSYDMTTFASLPDQDYVKKIMSLATDEYPDKGC